MEHFLEAFFLFFRWDILLLCVGGATVGLVVGAIPGVSGGMTMILMLPLAFALESVQSMVLLISVHLGAVSGGYIGSILLGVPGETGSLATVYDGYEFTKQGDPVRALSVAAVASFIGTIPGVLFAMILCRWIANLAIKLGPWEIFAIGCSAVVMISSLSEGNMWKGILGACIGFLVSCIGFAPVSGTPRFTFGFYYLAGGFERVSVILGIFAGRTIFMEFIRQDRGKFPPVKVSRFKLQRKDFTGNISNIFRSLGIGLWLGVLPGLGASIANIIAYATQKKFSKNKDSFGKGNIEGVWAPEVANNGCIGGDLIPTITLGIPGSGAMAYLLMGLIIAGIEPGPLLMINQPVLVYVIFVALLVGAVGILLFEIVAMPLFPLILRTPYHILFPTILCLCFVGAFVAVGNISATLVLIAFTLVGICFTYANIPPVTFVIAFVLGNLLERNFRNALSLSPELGWKSFFVRPVSCVLIILLVVLLFYPTVKKAILRRNAKLKAIFDQVQEDEDD